jgi:hypothetical protein
MPTPISGANTYDTSRSAEREEFGPPPPPITVEPVYIDGDAGARELVKQHPAGGSRECREQALQALNGGLGVAGGVLGTLAAASAGPLGIAAGIAVLVKESIDEGSRLRALYDCKTQ